MDIGKQILNARKSKGMTQAELGDKMCVTFQAVSKWERGESVPDFETICKLADVLEMPITYFGGRAEDKPKTTVVAAAPERAEPRPVLAVCEKCNRPIYDASRMVRNSSEPNRVKCIDCVRKENDEKYDKAVASGKRRRVHAFIWPTLVFIVGMLVSFLALSGTGRSIGIVASVLAFALLACLILYNNVVSEVVWDVLEWSAVTFPGIIFSFDIDGFIFLILMKILFFVLSVAITLGCAVLAFAIGGVVAVFVYPFALGKNFKSPEKGEYSCIE